jgi:hypothetical protein
LIIGVLAAIAVTRRPRYHLRDRGPFPGQEEPELISEPLQAGRGDVVLHTCNLRLCIFLGAIVVIVVLVVECRVVLVAHEASRMLRQYRRQGKGKRQKAEGRRENLLFRRN